MKLTQHCVFSIRHIPSYMCLRILDSTSTLHMGTILKNKITIKKHKNVESVALNRPQKGQFNMRVETKWSGITLFNLIWVCVPLTYCSARLQMTTEAPLVLPWGYRHSLSYCTLQIFHFLQLKVCGNSVQVQQHLLTLCLLSHLIS